VVKPLGRPAPVRPLIVTRRNAAVRAVVTSDGRRAQLSTRPGQPVSTVVIRECLERLAAANVEEAVTPALTSAEVAVWTAAGLRPATELVLLRLELDRPRPRPRSTSVPLRRCTRRDWPSLEALDRRAFGAFWHLDAVTLADAADVTSMARVRVAGDQPVGYAICGLSDTTGYVQRLAVDPADQGRGVAGALLLDGLTWLERHGATEVYVNTEPTNERALALYTSFGFTPEPERLVVLSCRP
jgi:ribosomal protein S18 acetylase RimI-like enzyme